MTQFSSYLNAVHEKQRPMLLIASLPTNNPELVHACLNGGADVIKVHINLNHRASANALGTLAQERESLEEILEVCKDHPCGIVPGADPEKIDPSELDELVSMGFDFLSLYLRDAPLGVLPPSSKLERMLALSSEDSLDLCSTLDSLDIQALEASIMPKETYGQPLTYRDLAQYRQLRLHTRLPIVVPTQHKCTPAALSELSAVGIEALMIGTIVAGQTPENWQRSFKAFREEADRLFESKQEFH